ncbi:MAG: M48 family metallopeptidase [Pirellulales bacterium]
MAVSINHSWWRLVFLLGALFTDAALAWGQGAGRNPNGTPTFPFDFSNPERMMERMFGASSPEEQRLLDAVKVSIDDEQTFGAPIVKSFLNSLKDEGTQVVDEGADIAYLEKLVETVRPLTANPDRYGQIKIYLIDTPKVDARAFPGGTLFFTRGLLDECGSEAALIGLIGHELSHLDRGHVLVPLKRARLMQQAPAGFANGFQNGFNPDQFFGNAMTTMRMMGRPFRPEDEAEADRDGVAWAIEAGYDPLEMAKVFARAAQKMQDPNFPFADFFRSHPRNDDRVAAIQDQVSRLRRKGARRKKLYRGVENLAQRIPKSEQQFEE